MKTSLTQLVHGESGVGKSWYGDTSPAPRLILDAEGRAKYTPSAPKMWWDPLRYAPPVYDGTWETCVVNVTEFDLMQTVYTWLATQPHPFVSMTADSLMEIQKRCIDKIAGVNQLDQQNWGEVLRRIESLVRSFRDLTLVETNQLQCVTFIVGSVNDNGKMRPLLQGQLHDTVAYYLDVVGYLYSQPTPDGQDVTRHLLTQQRPNFVAKDGTGKLPHIIDSPHIGNIFSMLEANGGTPPVPQEVQAA